jgi:hypothetical protein
MKKIMLLVVLVCFMVIPVGVQAFTINDAVPDAIGVRTFESYGINVYNYTPGVYSGGIAIDLFTNYPQSGLPVSGWNTEPADLFITETYYGSNYLWAIPLVSHDTFTADTMYAVGTYHVSDDYEPDEGGYGYNHNVPVRIASMGNNYNYERIGSFTVTWNDLMSPGSPDWMIHITSNVYQDDPNGVWAFTWGTATCGNDVISGRIPSVPEPATMLLLGLGLVGIGLLRRKQ